MVKDAFYFLTPLAAGAAAAAWAGWNAAAAALVGLGLFVAFFFRDPERVVPADPSTIVAPADGRVVRIEKEDGGMRISIFLSIFNVHVNRAPIGGRISGVEHRRGRFHAAFNDAASIENERNTLMIEGSTLTVACSQIAGVVARRIVCWKRPGDRVEKGERFGLIRFGSRVDLVLPAGVELAVRVGDAVRAGATVVGRTPEAWREAGRSSEQPARL